MDPERRRFEVVVSTGEPGAYGSKSPGRFSRVKAVLIALLVASIFIGFLIAAILLGSILAMVLVVLAAVATTVALFKAAIRSARRRL
jgi:hypothetical protein